MVNVNDLFNELANEEQDFLKREFLAPVVRGNPVRVKISGIVLTLKVTRYREQNQNWCILRPTSHKTAVVVREANLVERQRYLNLFPSVRLILCVRKENQWFGLPGSSADGRFICKGLCPVSLPVEPQLFDLIIARFDGVHFWYEQSDPVHSPQISMKLRERLAQFGEPKHFQIPGLTAEEREAYTMAFAHELESRKDLQEERIKHALARGGAQYRSYIERGNSFTVEYLVDGRTHRSTVHKDTLRVQSAGICLTDHDTGREGDSDFDLQSLVGVIREGQGRHLVHRQ